MRSAWDEVPALREQVLAGELSRRDVLSRALGLGLSAPLIAGLLAACGGDDDDDDAEAEATATPAETDAEPTATRSAPGANQAATQTAEAGAGEAEEPTATEETSEEATATEEAVARGGGGKITLLYWQAPTILNAHLGQGSKDTHAAWVCMEPLAQFDVDTQPELMLAAEWPTVDGGTLDPDGRFVIWKLREGVKWHDGEDFTAEDVKFTYEYITNEETTSTSVGTYAAVESVEIIDDYTVQVNFAEPNPAWFDPFVGGAGFILPEHILGELIGEAARDAEFNLMPIGTGPFRVVDFNPGDVVLYELFEDYWDAGKPFFDEVEIKGGGDATSAARAVLVTGEADWAWNLQVEPEILEQMESEGGEGALIAVPGNSAEMIYINFADPNVEIDGARAEPSTEHPIWKHKQAREALNLAVQRDVIADQLYGAAGVATAHALNVPEKFKPDFTWEYDLGKAKAKLAEIDFPAAFDDTTLLYQTSVNSVRQKNQEIVKADLEELGFTVELKSIDAAVYFSSDAGNPDTWAHFYADIQMFTTGPGEPYPISWTDRYRTDQISSKANNWSGANAMRYNNPEYDPLHDQARVEIDEERQIEIWQAMMTLVHEDIVEVPIVWRGGAAAVHKRIANWRVSNWGDSTPVAYLKHWTLA